MTSADDEPDEVEYRIEVSDTATEETDAIYLWIGRSDPDLADRWYRQLVQIYDGLRIFPFRNASVSLRRDVRRTLHGSYRIVYLVIEPTGGQVGIIRVLRVVHGSRQSEDLPDDIRGKI